MLDNRKQAGKTCLNEQIEKVKDDVGRIQNYLTDVTSDIKDIKTTLQVVLTRLHNPISTRPNSQASESLLEPNSRDDVPISETN